MTIVKEGLARDAFADIAEPGKLAPVTPGEVLREEFIAPLGLSARQLARDLGVSPDRITEIMRGERAITAETALLLARRFGTSARFWLNLQAAHDLAVAERAAPSLAMDHAFARPLTPGVTLPNAALLSVRGRPGLFALVRLQGVAWRV